MAAHFHQEQVLDLWFPDNGFWKTAGEIYIAYGDIPHIKKRATVSGSLKTAQKQKE